MDDELEKAIRTGTYPPKALPPSASPEAPDRGAGAFGDSPFHSYRAPSMQARRPPTAILKVGAFAALSLAVAAAGWLIVGGLLGAHERPAKPAKRDAFAPELPVGFDQTRAVTLCDLNMQRQMISRGSYKAAWGWDIAVKGELVAVRRGFSAQNLHGVRLDSEYTCLVGASTGRVVGLQFRDGGRTVVLGPDEVSN